MNAVPECPGEEGEHDEEEEDESDGRSGGHGRHDRPGFSPIRSAAATSFDPPTAAVPVPCDHLALQSGDDGRYHFMLSTWLEFNTI